jgi:hypothetical protein
LNRTGQLPRTASFRRQSKEQALQVYDDGFAVGGNCEIEVGALMHSEDIAARTFAHLRRA